MCRKFLGNMFYPATSQEQMERSRVLNQYADLCGYRGWVGLWDVPQDGNWTVVHTGKEPEHTK